MEENKTQATKADLIKTIIGIALCVVFGFILICNIIIIVGGALNEERPPAVFGITPLVVTSGSMSGDAPDHIEVGDLIFLFLACKSAESFKLCLHCSLFIIACGSLLLIFLSSEEEVYAYVKRDRNSNAEDHTKRLLEEEDNDEIKS